MKNERYTIILYIERGISKKLWDVISPLFCITTLFYIEKLFIARKNGRYILVIEGPQNNPTLLDFRDQFVGVSLVSLKFLILLFLSYFLVFMMISMKILKTYRIDCSY